MRGYFSLFCMLVLIMLLNAAQLHAAEPGRETYNEYCFICHGTGMQDVPQFGDVEHWASRTEKGMEALYNAAIYGVNAMPPMGLCDECTEEQMKEAVDYMVNSSH